MSDAAIDFGPDAERRALQAGEVLCREGDDGDEIFQIVSGGLEVEKATGSGPLIVARLGAGQIVGEITYALGGLRTATLRASEPTVVTALSHDAFVAWQIDNPDEAAALAKAARHRMNRTRASGVLTELLGTDHDQLISSIVDEVTWRTLAPGDTLFEQGDVADAAYVVVAGRLEVIATDDTGKIVLDREIGRGELVGEMGIIEDAPRSAGAFAIRETTLASISRETFERYTSRQPNLMLRIFRSILGRLTHTYTSDDRARVVTAAVTIPGRERGFLADYASAVAEFGSTLHLSSANLGQFVRDLDGPGASARVAEFLHEADVAHDYVLLETDDSLTPWSISAVKQSDRFVVFASAEPDDAERALIADFLSELNERQRPAAWIVRIHPQWTRQPRRSASFLDDFGIGEVHNVQIGNVAHMSRVGRLATGNGRGLVLGGGGARGMAHIGALRAMKELGVEFDRVAGASMGSVVGAFAAMDRTPDEMLELAISQLENLLDYTIPLVSFIKAERMSSGMQEYFADWDITDLWVPFFCVSTNLTRAELAVHRRGSLVTAVRASIAIPVMLPPVPINGDLHVDGGVLDNVPVRPMRDDNSIGTIIAIDVSPPSGPSAGRDFGLSVSGVDVLRSRLSRKRLAGFPDLGQVLMSSMLIGSSRARNQIDDEKLIDLLLELDLADVGLMKFENHAAVAQKGYDSAKPTLDAWLAAKRAAVEAPTD